MSGHVAVVRQGPLALVTLSHPGKFNAMSRAMWRELRAIFLDLPSQDGLRVVLLRGEGGHFCAGGDISEYQEFRFEPESLRAFHEDEVWGGLSAVLACELPVLAQIEGHCMGAGVEIASCCDLRLASACARFGAPIAKLGFPMAPREAALVTGAVGELTAREMLLAARVLDAPTMLARGFLSEVCEDTQLSATSLAWAERVAKLAPQAARMNKRTLSDLQQARAAGLAPLLAGAYGYADSAEHREGIAAFLAKRPPVFS